MTGLRILAILASAALAVSCTAPLGAPYPSARDVLTGEEVRASGASDAEAALRALRPEYLRRRGADQLGSVALIYIDGVRAVDGGALRAVSTLALERIEYLGPRDATLRFGGGHSAGALVVTTIRSGSGLR